MDFSSKRTYGIAMAALGFIAWVGYGLLFVIFAKSPDLKKKNRFLFSLAVSDLLITIHVVASVVASFQSEWPFGSIGCQLDAFIGMAPTFISIAGAALVAKDKYYRICKPKMVGRNYSFSIYANWTLGIIGGLLPFFGFGQYGFETDDLSLRTGCLLDFKTVSAKYRFYIVFISLVWFVWPLYKLTSHYIKISAKLDRFHPLMFVVPLQMLVSLLPYAIYAMISITVGVSSAPYYLVAVNNIAAKVFIGTNPFIYIYFDPELRLACKNLFKYSSTPVQDQIQDKKDE
uniref:G-protein coupled receptors family 1 profile domain-containing protein n=1 Tax=Ciona savignyi TaxID=51511 RepID=H2ZM95_CIOSA